MSETQNIEYKQNWRDEYLKWICGFANAQGGTIFVGIDDNGGVCGVENAKRLMEEIPNKARDVMGVIVDVNLHEKDDKEYLEGWTIDNLLGSHRSRPYNPDIANVFFRAGEIETWGRGIERIIMACKNYGCPSPVFRYSNGEMWMVFPFSDEYQKNIKENARESSSKSSSKGLSKSLSKNQQNIIALMKENPQISTREIATVLGLTQRMIMKHINDLKASGLIKRVGANKGGHWEVI